MPTFHLPSLHCTGWLAGAGCHAGVIRVAGVEIGHFPHNKVQTIETVFVQYKIFVSRPVYNLGNEYTDSWRKVSPITEMYV